MGNLIFNGISSEDLGLVIQAPPSYEFPEKDYETIHVPGRTGDIVIDKHSYKNVDRTYYLASVFKNGTSFVHNANQIVKWLHSASGYARLEDTYEPDYFRLAMFKDGGYMSNYYDEATLLTASFICKPQRYLKTGENPITVTSQSFQITNPTSYESDPLIMYKFLEGSDLSNVTISIKFQLNNGSEYITKINVSSSGITSYDTIFYIDSYSKDANSDPNTLQPTISLENEFPRLGPGITTITITNYSKLEFIKIVPRWWVI